MTQTEFLNALSGLSNSYNWSYEDNTVLGVARYGKDRGSVYNPVTAVARSLRVGSFPNTKGGTSRAARALGLSQNLALAVLSSSNRGHAQIIRGKVLESVFTG